MFIEEIIIATVLDILKLFKGNIIAWEKKSPILLQVISWCDGIADDVKAYAEGKDLPPLKTGHSVIDGIGDLILNFIAKHLQSPQQLKNILDEISLNALAILAEFDSPAAQQYAARQVANLTDQQKMAVKANVDFNTNANHTPAQKDVHAYVTHKFSILEEGRKIWQALKAELEAKATAKATAQATAQA